MIIGTVNGNSIELTDDWAKQFTLEQLLNANSAVIIVKRSGTVIVYQSKEGK